LFYWMRKEGREEKVPLGTEAEHVACLSFSFFTFSGFLLHPPPPPPRLSLLLPLAQNEPPKGKLS